MVEIDLRRREDIPEFEDFDKFCNSGKEAPDVSLFMHITYAIKDIEVTTMLEECEETVEGLNALMSELRLDDSITNEEIMQFFVFMFNTVGGC